MRPLLVLVILFYGVDSQCPNGYSMLFSSNQLVTCNPQNSCSCASISAGYTCQFSSQNNQYVCCGVQSSQCPSSSAQLTNGVIQTCQTSSNCAQGYYCNINTCCASQSSQCSNGGTTQCSSGQVLVNGVCTNQVSIGSFCQSSLVCMGGSQCTNGICQCPNGAQATNNQCQNSGNGQCSFGSVFVNNQCMQQVSPGSQCTSSLQCLDNSICSGGICTCQNNAQVINGYCITYTGGPCQSTQVLINNVCQTYSIVGGSCVGSAQCVGGSTCLSSVCGCPSNTQNLCFTSNGVQNCYCLSSSTNSQCGSGMVLVNGQCMNQIQLGSFGCSVSQQCAGNGICQNGACQCAQGTTQQGSQCITSSGFCQSGQVLVNGQCMNQIQLGSFGCSVSQQCAGNGICQNGACQCAQGTTQQGSQCITSGGFCQSGQVLVNGQCMNQIQLGSFGCTVSQQCVGNGICQNGACQCAQGTTQQGSQCITSSGFCQSGQVLVNGQCMNQIQLGSFGCSFSQQCVGNGVCQNGACQCAQGTTQQGSQCITSSGFCQSGQVLVNGQCMNQIQLGSFGCTVSQQCVGNGICQNGACQCAQGTTQQGSQCITSSGFCQSGQVLVNGQCMNQIQLGSFGCSFSQQCVGNGVCQNGACQCAQGTTQQGSQCITSSGFCQSGQVLVNGQCMNQIQLGSFGCSVSQQCAGNGICQNGACQCAQGTTQQGSQCITSGGFCQSGQVLVNGQCLNQIQLGSFGCSFSQQCLGNGVCQNGACQCAQGTTQQGNQCITSSGFCQSGQVLVNGQCMNQIQLGSFGCSVSQQCAGNGICQNGACQCAQGTTQQGNQCITSSGFCQSGQVLVNGQCMNQIQLGSFGCSVSQQCAGNGICQNGACQCAQGTTQQGNQCITSSGFCQSGQVLVNGQCMNQIQLGSFGCSVSQQCAGNGICQNGACQCAQGTTQQGNQCITSSGFCQSGQVLVNGQCMNQIQLGSFGCSFSQQCLGNSVCTNSMCQCAQGTIQQGTQCISSGSSCQINQVLVNGQCMNTVQLGSYGCYSSLQCLGNSQCSSQGQCLCPSGTTQQGTVCQSTGLSCQLGSVLINGACIQMSPPGSQCSSTSQCLENAICNFNTCTCQNNAQSISGYCVPQSNGFCSSTQAYINGQCVSYGILGNTCQVDQQCLGGSNCISGFCACNQSKQRYCLSQNGIQACYCIGSGSSITCQYGQVLVNGQCMQQIQIGSFGCSYSQQCTGNGQCNNGYCQCPSGSYQQGSQCIGSTITCQYGQVLINGQCYSTYNPGTYGCTYTQQCLGNSQCYSGYCQCPSNTVIQGTTCVTNGGGGACQSYQIYINGQCFDTVSIGMQCTYQQQCLTSNSICSGTCTCSSGLSYNGSACVSSAVFCSQGTVVVSNACRSLVSLGQFCQSTVQCIGFGVCGSNQFCSCPSGTIMINNACRSSGSTSTCYSNQVLIGNQCYNTIALGQFCTFSQQCQGNGTCSNAICSCPQGTTNYGDGICRGASSNGNFCSAGETAQYSNNQLINCFTTTCPTGSYCKYNSLYSQYICCRPGSSTSLTCSNPANSVVYQNGVAINCLTSACPSNSMCEYNSSAGQYVCCQSSGSTSSTCQGQYYTYSNNSPYICTSDSTCASIPNYSYCRLAPGLTYSVCCNRY